MKLVSITSGKGGTGKTTLAVNLCAAAHALKLRPLLVCLDSQGSALHFGDSGNLPFTVLDAKPESRPDADLVVFDYAASDWTVPSTRLVVVPTTPNRDSYRVAMQCKRMADDAGRQTLLVLNQVQPSRTNDRELIESTSAFVVPSASIYGKAAALFTSIFDSRLDRAYKAREHRQTINQLLARIMMETDNELG